MADFVEEKDPTQVLTGALEVWNIFKAKTTWQHLLKKHYNKNNHSPLQGKRPSKNNCHLEKV
jgi:hypothetical protein